MDKLILPYFTFLATYFVLDMLWIKLTSQYHKTAIEGVQKVPLKIDMLSGTLYYLVVSFLIIYALTQYTKTTKDWFILGFIIALTMFFTFDITNKTVFTNYPYWYVGMDIVGGVSSIMLSLLVTWIISVYVPL